MPRKQTTLVIHPSDTTTDFLNVIYQGTDWTVINHDIPDQSLRTLISRHDRIIMLGHGFPGGLLGYDKIVINASHLDLLRTKKLVGIWCFANQFFEPNGLLGIYTDMIISEPQEAEVFGVEYTDGFIDRSNKLFALAVRDSIISDEPIQTFKEMYRSNLNPVIKWNQDNFYHAYEVIQI
jgi:hypothetical protein